MTTSSGGLRHLLRAGLPRDLPPGTPGDPGLFGPGSVAWRLNRERVLLAGGPAALLLQVAHPLVAAGVAEHSGFTADPVSRLRGTLDATLTVTFGDTAQARAAAGAVGRRHAPVRGTLAATAGGLPAGTPYRATDPELALWVWATLVWSAVRVTERYLRSVPTGERDAYCAESVRLGVLFGVRPAGAPATWADLDAYVTAQVRSVLHVGPAARDVATAVLHPRPPLLPPGLRGLPRLLAADLLPPAVADAYGLRPGRPGRTAVVALRAATRLTAPLLPRRVRWWPHHRTAVDRATAG